LYNRDMNRLGFLVLTVGVFLTPIFIGADVLDQPFFEGVLGRTAYSIPAEYTRSTGVDNPLRFAVPAELDVVGSLESVGGAVVGVLDATVLATIDDSKNFISMSRETWDASRGRLLGAAWFAWRDLMGAGTAIRADVLGAMGETRDAWRALPGELNDGLLAAAHVARGAFSRVVKSVGGRVRVAVEATHNSMQTAALFATVYLSSVSVSGLEDITVPEVPIAPQEIEVVFVERSEPLREFTCSRAGGFARYAWCLMHIQRAL